VTALAASGDAQRAGPESRAGLSGGRLAGGVSRAGSRLGLGRRGVSGGLLGTGLGLRQ
jgi:hypothetical protein